MKNRIEIKFTKTPVKPNAKLKFIKLTIIGVIALTVISALTYWFYTNYIISIKP